VKADGTIVIIGGSSGIGLAVARRSLDDGATVVIAGRSQQRLDAARADVDRTGPPAGRLSAYPVDIGDPAQVARLFERVGTLSHLVVTAADLPYGPVVSLSEDSMVRAVRSKILGPLFAAQQAAPRITKPGSITFTSGIAASRPAPGGALAATVNGALESMVLALALELAPIRVNAVSPGWVDTPVWDRLATPDVKNARMADLAARLPARRLGRPEDIANAVAFLIADNFVTGTVLHAEGAQVLV
jgi:NAD(P)-dependent dehydrogenase (short-subunit alcohol dehydrogenase family)